MTTTLFSVTTLKEGDADNSTPSEVVSEPAEAIVPLIASLSLSSVLLDVVAAGTVELDDETSSESSLAVAEEDELLEDEEEEDEAPLDAGLELGRRLYDTEEEAGNVAIGSRLRWIEELEADERGFLCGGNTNEKQTEEEICKGVISMRLFL